MAIPIDRLPLRLTPDPGRVIMRFFGTGNINRARDIIKRVLAFPEVEVESLLAAMDRDYRPKHEKLFEVFAEHFAMIRGTIPEGSQLSESRQLLLGACFTMEYAIESVALFNPSIVPALRQEDVPAGSVRFVMSLRATGEGHLSSIVFRVGMIDADGEISSSRRDLQPDAESDGARRVQQADILSRPGGLGRPDAQSAQILDRLRSISLASSSSRRSTPSVGRSHFRVPGIDRRHPDRRDPGELSASRVERSGHREAEIVIFPFSDIERHGIEDLRLVRFTDDDGSVSTTARSRRSMAARSSPS